MKAFRRFLVGLFLLANLLLLGCLSFYVIRLPGKLNFRLLPKNQLSLVHTYQDTRDWTPDDLTQHTEFVNRVIESGHADWLPQIPTTNAAEPSSTTAPVTKK